MSRTISGGMVTHLSGSVHYRCNMLRLDLVDGSTLAITDHDRDIDYDLGDGSVTYLADTGIIISNLALSIGFEGVDIEAEGPINDVVTLTHVIGGRYDDAVARFFQFNWGTPANGVIKLMKGLVILAEVEGGRFKFTINGEIVKYNQQIGRVISGFCAWDFGVGICDRVPVTAACTVTSVTDEREFVFSFTGTYANDYFNRGKVSFLTGSLAGTRAVEIFDFTGGTNSGSVKLWLPLAEPPQVGDTFTISQGCYDVATDTSKTREACMAIGGDAVPFGGFPDVPGSDQVLRYPNPGGSA